MKGYLTKGGQDVYDEIKKHCEEKLKWIAIDSLELTMLANSFDCYARASKICNDEGFANAHSQIRPEYTVMKTEYANILKHSAKFGLNQTDRDKLFKKIEPEEPVGKDRFKMAVAK